MSKNDEQKESPKHTQFYIKDIQLTELNNHVGWTTEIIYVNKAKDMCILLFIQAWVKNITTFVLLNKFSHLL
jgi:hypothetical protein